MFFYKTIGVLTQKKKKYDTLNMFLLWKLSKSCEQQLSKSCEN